jgi:dGTPase
VRHRADLVVPRRTKIEIGILKGIAAHYVMQAQDRVDLMERQRDLMSELFEALWRLGADGLDPSFVEDWEVAGDDLARRRVIVDQVASYTDARAINRHAQLTGRG